MHTASIARSLAFALFLAAGSPAGAADACDAPAETWQPRSAVRALAQRNGWDIHKLKIDDGCYEIKGRDADGRRFKAKLDPATLQVIRLKRGEALRERQRDRLHDPASGSPASRDPG